MKVKAVWTMNTLPSSGCACRRLVSWRGGGTYARAGEETDTATIQTYWGMWCAPDTRMDREQDCVAFSPRVKPNPVSCSRFFDAPQPIKLPRAGSCTDCLLKTECSFNMWDSSKSWLWFFIYFFHSQGKSFTSTRSWLGSKGLFLIKWIGSLKCLQLQKAGFVKTWNINTLKHETNMKSSSHSCTFGAGSSLEREKTDTLSRFCVVKHLFFLYTQGRWQIAQTPSISSVA